MAIYERGDVLQADTEAEFTARNTYLGEGQIAHAKDTGVLKIGPGNWNVIAGISGVGGVEGELAAGTHLVLNPPIAGTSTIEIDGVFVDIAQPLWARATGDVTRSSTAAVADDSQLLVGVDANALYEVHAHIIYDSGTTPDFRHGWTGPAGATLDWNTNAIHSGVTITSGIVTRFSSAIGDTAISGGAGAGTNMAATINGFLDTSSTAGNLVYRWAQGTSDASNTIRKAGSILVLHRLD